MKRRRRYSDTGWQITRCKVADIIDGLTFAQAVALDQAEKAGARVAVMDGMWRRSVFVFLRHVRNEALRAELLDTLDSLEFRRTDRYRDAMQLWQ